MISEEELKAIWPYLTNKEKDEIIAHTKAIETFRNEWKPLPGPQTQAYFTPADILFYGGAAGGGKYVCLHSMLPTPSGWKEMGNVQVGDQLFDEKGNICNVIVVEHIVNNVPTYKVIFSDGTEIIAGGPHKWVTETYKDRLASLKLTDEWREKRRAKRPSRSKGKRPDVVAKNIAKAQSYKEIPLPTVKTTEEIKETLLVGKRLNHSIKVCSPLNLPWILLPLDPYVLGAWLGDGTSKGGSITGLDTEIFEEIRKAGFIVTDYAEIKHKGILKLVGLLKKINLYGNKHIPEIYLRSSTEQRLSLLQGLMDTDGFCDTRGQCEFTNTNKILIDQTYELICSLGIKATICEGRATLYGKDCGPKYRIKFLTDLPAFRLPRKLARQKREGFRGTHERRYVVDIKLIDPVPMRCIAVDSPSHLYLISKSFIPTHNTDLLLGLAHLEHQKTIIFRREYTQLQGIIDRGMELFDLQNKGKFNNQKYFWKIFDQNRIIKLGACKNPGDENSHMGIPHDLKAFDEVTHFTEQQFRFLCGWLRSADPKQRKRIICTGNPPTNPEGDWVIRYWAPWLDDHHPNPALPGELRWYTTIDGDEVEVPNGEPFEHDGEWVKPESRTFIPAKIEDNPYLMEAGYKARLQALPEPLRSKMLKGDFTAGREDDAWQVIPTEWVRLAQERWRQMQQPDIAMSALGVDVARGGGDATVISARYGNYFAKQISHPGLTTPDGDAVAGLVFKERKDKCPVIVDVIGVGSAVYDALRREAKTPEDKLKIIGFNASKPSNSTDRTRNLTFVNQRAEWYWRLREALDPKTGENLALPDDRELLVDLCAARWEWRRGGVKVEDKDEIIKRIGRSPDKGDSCVFAFVTSKARPIISTRVPFMGR